MPADNLIFLVDHFSRFNAGGDPVLTARFFRSPWHEADRCGLSAADLLVMAEEHRERPVAHVPDAVPVRYSVSDW